MKIFKRMKFASKGLKYKLMLAFSLMSIIPLLAFGYVLSIFVFPGSVDIINISAIVVASIVVAVLGLIFARGLIDPVVDMAIEANIIAGGDYDRRIAVSSDDEVGNLAMSINSMTQRVKSNLDELKSYSHRMREINIDINRKVLVLSNLLQISNLISSGTAKLDDILEMAVHKAASLFDDGFGLLYMPIHQEKQDFIAKVSFNARDEKMLELTIKRGEGLFGKTLENLSTLTIDSSTKRTGELDDFKKRYDVGNIVAVPIFSGRQDLALFVVGNRVDDFEFKTDEIDLINIFAKQISIAIENDMLAKKGEELAITDDLTGLYNKNYIKIRLEEEIKRAIFYQRPCSFIVFNIDNFRAFREAHGELVAEEVLRKMAKIVKDYVLPVGKAARVAGDEFVMLLPEKNKREAMSIAEDVRKKVETTNFMKEGKVSLTVSCGVSENPIDGATQDELFKKATTALLEAKSAGKNRVAA